MQTITTESGLVDWWIVAMPSGDRLCQLQCDCCHRNC